MESKKLKDLVKEVQFRSDLTLDDIAKKIGYSPSYFRNAINKGENEKLRNAILKEFGNGQIVSRETQQNATTSQIKPVADPKDQEIIQLLKEKIERLQQDKASSVTQTAALTLNQAYLSALHHHVIRLRAKMDGKPVDHYDAETVKLVSEFLLGADAGDSPPGKDTVGRKKPYNKDGKVKV